MYVGLQVALHLPDGSETWRQIFNVLYTDETKGENFVQLLETHYQKDVDSLVLET